MQDLKHVFSYLKPYRRDLFLAVGLVFVECIFEMVIPMLMSDLVDQGVPSHDMQVIMLQGSKMILCAVLALITGLLYARFAARAAVADPPVLILDEATSSIDTRTEALIEKGMDRLMEGRTVFVIAHRLSTVRNSNAIIVLEHGGIVERGSHDELLAQKGEYYQLYNGMFELA